MIEFLAQMASDIPDGIADRPSTHPHDAHGAHTLRGQPGSPINPKCEGRNRIAGQEVVAPGRMTASLPIHRLIQTR